MRPVGTGVFRLRVAIERDLETSITGRVSVERQTIEGLENLETASGLASRHGAACSFCRAH